MDPEAYRRYARPGIERAAESDSELLAIAAVGSIARGYNLLLDLAARYDELEALVLVNQEVELTDPGACTTIRDTLPCRRRGNGLRRRDRCAEHRRAGGPGTRRRGDPGVSGARTRPDARLRLERDKPGARGGGDAGRAVLCLWAWPVRHVRLDEGLGLGQGYDLDYCFQLREHGRSVVAADLPAIYHRPLELVDDKDLFIESHIQTAEKWEGRMPGFGRDADDWRQRARRAEAEREAARTIAYSTASEADARAQPLERELEALEATASWRLTRPLREINARLARRRA